MKARSMVIAGAAAAGLILGLGASARVLWERPAASASRLLRRCRTLYDRKEWAAIYREADPELQRTVSLTEWQARFQDLHAVLGSITARSESGFTVSFRSPITLQIEVRGVNEFQNGRKKEERARFVMRPFREPKLVDLEWHDMAPPPLFP